MQECERTFNDLKELLVLVPLLQSLNEGEMLLLYMGVGEDAINFVLM